jgi:hypothetical protein
MLPDTLSVFPFSFKVYHHQQQQEKLKRDYFWEMVTEFCQRGFQSTSLSASNWYAANAHQKFYKRHFRTIRPPGHDHSLLVSGLPSLHCAFFGHHLAQRLVENPLPSRKSGFFLLYG